MSARIRWNATSLLLASTALLTIGDLQSSANAELRDRPLQLAQAPAPAPAPAPGASENDKDKKKAPPPGARPQPRTPPAGPPQGRPQPPAGPPRAQTPPPAPAQNAQPASPPAAAPKVEEHKPAAQDQRRDERREQRPGERRPGQPPTPTVQQPPARQAPSNAQQPGRQPTAPVQERREERREAPPQNAQQPATTPGTPPAPPPAAQDRRQAPAGAAQRPGPAATPQPGGQPAAAPAAIAPPTQARDAREFIRREGGPPDRGISQLRQERKEVREGNRTVIREQDRTIIREGDRTIIRHNEGNRFAIDARNIRTERRGGEFETIIERPNGVTIINITDADGRLIRRLRRAGGRDIIIIDNGFAGPRPVDLFVQLAPPVIRIPRERYILDADRARPGEIYDVFMEGPVERIDRRYTLDQVRFSAPLRDRMPRVDLDVTFDTGSWQLTPDQVGRLAAIADGINRAVERNPREVFLIEGHTDAIGNDVDNLSLSDRRAEAVAVALTEQFRVPAENLVTQGYGEQYLKVPTQEAERANRRVAARRITPLIDQQAQSAPPPR